MTDIGCRAELVCPCCGMPMKKEGGSLVCENRHTYDIAKAGYVNLTNTTSKKLSGDSKEMVRARTDFLGHGAYAPFMEQVCRLAGGGRVCVDAGCGEGYYTVGLSHSFEMVYGFDLSKASCMAAAKRARAAGADGRCFFGVGSVYSLPIADGCADCVTNIFAPCVEEEYSRILRAGGKLVVACAGVHHLQGLKDALYDTTRENTARADLPTHLVLEDSVNVSYDITLTDREMIKNLYMMTPYCYRTGIEAQKKLLSLDTLTTRVDFDIHIYRK